MNNIDRYKKDLKALISLGELMKTDLAVELFPEQNKITDDIKDFYQIQVKGKFGKQYQNWYTECIALFAQILPERMEEFIKYYMPDPKRKNLVLLSYTIKDWLSGVRLSSRSIAFSMP